MNDSRKDTAQDRPWARLGRLPTYQLVLERVREQLASMALRAGDELPSERRLSELLGASRPAVREAVRVLQTHGIIGHTPVAVPEPALIIEPSPADGLTTTLRMHLAAASLSCHELTSTKIALEQASIRTLAQAERPDIVTHLESLVRTLSAPGLPIPHRQQADTDFHRTIVGHDGNRMTRHLLEAITGVTRNRGSSLVCSPDSCFNAPVSDYRQMVEAIRARDPERAAGRMELHSRREGADRHSVPSEVVASSDAERNAPQMTTKEEDH